MKRKIIFKSLLDRVKGDPVGIIQLSSKSDKISDLRINFAGIFRLIFTNYRLVGAIMIAVMFLSSIYMLWLPDRFQSTASILPTGGSDKLAALRELTGVGGGYSADDENSSLLYPAILKSRLIRDVVLDHSYRFRHGSERLDMTLEEYFGESNRENLRDLLEGLTTIDTDKKTGIIRIGVETEYPAFSEAILNQMLIELENFNHYQRRSSAGENARYLERELAVKRAEMEAAEDSLEAYQGANRNWPGSTDPEIIKIMTRLKRDVELKTRTYILLQEQYELARLDEQKDIPVVRILDKPSLPTLKSGPHRGRNVVLSGMAAFLYAVLFLLGVDTARKYRTTDTIKTSLPVSGHNRIDLKEGAKG